MSAGPDHAPLEEQIGQWRAYLRRRRAINGPDVEELETHLRDQVGVLTQAGLAGQRVEPKPRSSYSLFDLAFAAMQVEVCDVTGVVLTKLDGTAKGGIVIAVQRRLGIPVKLVGLGEGSDDLAPFDPAQFVDALLGTDA